MTKVTIAQELRRLQDMTPAELAARYESLFGEPPRNKNKLFLQRRIGWRLQEREFGGLSPTAMSRLDELIAEIDLPLHSAEPRRGQKATRNDPKRPLVGSVITRQWHDQEIRVAVLEHGFEWDGVTYKSLSAVARAITGAAWSGPLFFGLRTRRRAE